MTGDEFPSNIEDCIEVLDERGFSVSRGETNHDTPAVLAQRDETRVRIARTPDHQWWLTAESPDRPSFSEMYDRPRRVLRKTSKWLDGGDEE